MNKTEYCRITVFHKEKNLSAIFDNSGMYETLGDFRAHLLGRGNTIIAASTDEKFLDVNIGKVEYDEKQIYCMAYHKGEPIKTTWELDGVAYHAIEVDDMIYVPDREKRKLFSTAAPENKNNAAAGKGGNSAEGLYERYMRVKKENPGAIVFHRAGDFYEALSDDASTASSILGLTLTGRDCGTGERIPMCGVPFHTINNYIAKLMDWGFKVVIKE